MPILWRPERYVVLKVLRAMRAFPVTLKREPRVWLRGLRWNRKMTQDELAARSGVPRSHISRIERGEVDPQLSTLKRLFEAMGCRMFVLPSGPDVFCYIRKTGYRGSPTGA